MDNKTAYGLNVIFIVLLYFWAFMASTVIYNMPYLFLMYAFTFLFVVLPLSIIKNKALVYILLLTCFFPTAYSLFIALNIAPFTFLVNSLFSILGTMLGLMLLAKRKIVNGLGIAFILLYALYNLYLDISSPNYSLQSEMIDLAMFNSLFATAAISTARTLRAVRPKQYQPVIQQPAQQIQFNPRAATVIFRGLPPNCHPTIRLKGKVYYPRAYYQGDFIFELPSDTVLTLVNMNCQGTIYIPDLVRVRATVGKVVVINYSPVIPLQRSAQTPLQAPSIALMKRSLTDWDPNVWVNRNLSVYRVEKVIGEGGNGYVLKADYSGKPLAIKVLKLYGGSPEEYFKDLATEASNLVNLSNHKNIVKIYAINVDSFVIGEILKGKLDLYVTNPPMIVMEFMEGGTLKDLLENDSFYYSSKWQRNALRAICEVAQALDYIHSQGFVHMDVKPHNIFLSVKPKDPSELDVVSFKLGDLGSAVRVNSRIKQITPEYSPPDVFQDLLAKPHLDIFALGMTGYVILTRKMDRPDLDEMNNAIDCYVRNDMNCVKAQIDSAKAKLMNWGVNIDPKLDPLIQSMLSLDPAKRPTARDVVSMIRSIDPTIC